MTKGERLLRLLSIIRGKLLCTAGLDTRKNTASPELALRSWLRDLESAPPCTRSLVFLLHRNVTWVEWTVYACCWARHLGYAPIILYRSSELQQILRAPPGLGALMSWIEHGRYLEIVESIPDVLMLDLDREPDPGGPEVEAYSAFANDMAPTSAAYDLRVEEFEGGELEARYQREVTRYRRRLSEIGAVAETVLGRLLDKHPVARYVSYSGLIGDTPAFAEAARRVGLERFFAEGWAVKPGHMIYNLNGPSLEYSVQRWIDAVGPWDEKRIERVDKFLDFQESQDAVDADWLDDYHNFQRTTVNDQLPERVQAFLSDKRPLFLLGSNVVGDSATLRRATLFKNQREWLGAVCDYFIQHPEYKLVIRAHPDEHFLANKIVVKIGDVASAAARGAENILVIKGDEDVSTYALIPSAHAGLVWLSTIGADMIVRGCPVITAARAKYSGLGVAHEPDSPEAYFHTIERLAREHTCASDSQKLAAKQYLAVLSEEFSYDAFTKDYRGRNIRLSGHRPGGEADTFYRVLVGELPPETRPITRTQ